jgi:hypothetical protein
MSFSPASSPSSGGRPRLGLALAALCTLLGFGCFNDPKVDPSQTHHCKDDNSCPWGSVCGANGICCASADGKTCKVPPLSGDLDAAAIDSSGLDGKAGSMGDGSPGQETKDASLGGAGGAGGSIGDAILGGSGGSVTSDGSIATGGTSTVDAYLTGAGGASTGSGGTSTVDAPLDVPLAGTGGAGGAGTKLDATAGTGGTTTLSTGAKCTDDSGCTLGFCVDGVCCDSKCGGQCQACAETGSVGTCTTIQSGDPRGTRTPCTGTGKCKGQCDGSSATACKMPGNTMVCQTETCSLGQHTPESVCNGTGTCPSQTASTCSSGSCATDGSGKCLGACTSTSCPTGEYCASTGSCMPKKGNGPGNTCTTGAECTSTHCSSAEGICCDTDCTGQCLTCATGTCTRVASGQPVAGRAACTGSTDSTCGGRCDNTSDNCSYPPAGTSCLAATCTNSSTHQFAKTCPGSGGACASPTPPSETCAYGCTNGACAACTPNCTNKCGGASDGCSGTCTGQCSGNTICQSGACQSCGSLSVCNGSCVNLQSDSNNCGTCGTTCGSGLGCSAGQCGCTASSPNGTACTRPGQVNGTCWSGACVLPAYFPGCNTAADCVPGGCTGPGGYCLGTIDVAGEVNCTANSGLYVVCSASQGCSSGQSTQQVQCGNGSGGTDLVTCDGPSDCPADSDCCTKVAAFGTSCVARSESGVIGSGCTALQPNPAGPQSKVVCDPLNPTTTCPTGKSCVANVDTQVSFLCQ